MNKKYIIFIAILIFACKKEEDSNMISFSYKENISSSEIISDIELIKLETSDACLISHIKQLIIHDKKIFVLDASVGRNILAFDINGNFLHKIGQAGQGPGEYVLPRSISIDKNILYVMDAVQRKIILFDCNTFEFIKEDTNIMEAPFFSVLKNNNAYIWSNTMKIYCEKSYPFHLMVTDRNYNKLHTAVPLEIETGYIARWSFPFTYSKNSAYFTHPYKNIVYEIFADTCKQKHSINFEGFEFPPTDFLTRIAKSDVFIKSIRESGYINQFTYFETNDHIVSNFYAKENFYLGIFNKNKQQGICFGLKNVIEDIHMGCYDNPQTNDHDNFYSIIEASKIVENKANGLISDEILNTIGEIDEESNPVILKYKITY
jgi:hypothetical protein